MYMYMYGICACVSIKIFYGLDLIIAHVLNLEVAVGVYPLVPRTSADCLV